MFGAFNPVIFRRLFQESPVLHANGRISYIPHTLFYEAIQQEPRPVLNSRILLQRLFQIRD